MSKIYTLWDSTYLHGLYKGVPPRVSSQPNSLVCSSVSLWGRSLGQPGQYVGKTRIWIGFFVPWDETFLDIVLSSKERDGGGGGNSEPCKFMYNNHGYRMRIHHFPQPIMFQEHRRLIRIFQPPNLSDKEWRSEWWLQLLKDSVATAIGLRMFFYCTDF